MSDRTPDVLGSLLDGKKADPEATEKLQEQPIKDKPEPAQEKPSKELLESPEGKKAKATYYLDENVLALLDEAWLDLRKMAINRTSISKSWIVEQAIQMAVQELRDKGSKSSIAKRLPKE